MKLFRRQAVDASRLRWLAGIPVATPPGMARVAGGAIFACLLIAIAAVIIEVPERVRISGVMMPSGKVLAVRAPRAGIVDRLLVADGEWVGRGQPLLRIIDQRVPDGELSQNKTRMRSLDRELALLLLQFNQENEAADYALGTLVERRKLVAMQLSAAVAEVGARQRYLDVQHRRLQRIDALQSRGAVALERVDEHLAEQLQAGSALQAAEQRVIALRAQLLAGEREIEALRREPQRIAAKHGMQREALLRLKSQLVSADAEPVTSPDGGEVAALLVRDGSAVTTGQLLLNVIDADGELDAFMYLDSASAGRAGIGQAVEIQLHAYPYQRFGTIHAVVMSIAKVPVPSGSLAVPLERPGLVYEVRARIDAGRNAGFSQWHRVPAGASFSADVVRARWPLYRWVARALTKPV